MMELQRVFESKQHLDWLANRGNTRASMSAQDVIGSFDDNTKVGVVEQQVYPRPLC
jgi:hypothetical protein